MAQRKLQLRLEGTLVDKDGAIYGTLVPTTVDIRLDSAIVCNRKGGDPEEHAQDDALSRPPSAATMVLSSSTSSVAEDDRHQAVDVSQRHRNGHAREERLPGMDNRRQLIEEYARIFQRPKVTISAGRMRAAERAFKEEPDFDTLVRAIEGAKRYGDSRGRSYRFTDIFGTGRGTSTLDSRIGFFAAQADATIQVDPLLRLLPELDHPEISSDARARVRRQQRYVEDWLQNPDDEQLRDQGQTAAVYLQRTFRLTATVSDGTVRWQRAPA